MEYPDESRQFEQLERRAQDLRARVAAAALRGGRAESDVRIMAVTKTISAHLIRDAYALGFRLFGENRVQEAQSKISQVEMPGAVWELIGHLQTNKAARAVQLFSRVQSVDSVHLAETLNRQALAQNRVLPVLLEVNVAREKSKTGFSPADLTGAATEIARFPHLRPEGLMTVAPLVSDPEDVRPIFRELRALLRTLREHVPLASGAEWKELSMGMTDDFEVAIEEGSTLIRVGRGLFGARPPAHASSSAV